MKNKKGQKLIFNYFIAFLAIGIVVAAFITIPKQDAGFFEMNSYAINSTSDIEALDESANYSRDIQQAICDINQESSSCDDQTQTSLQGGTERIDDNILAGGYRVIVTITKSLGTTENLIFGFGKTLGIPEDMTNIIVAMLMGVIILTILLVIFNRATD